MLAGLIGFVTSPIGRYALIALAAFVWLQVHDAKIASRVRTECQEANLRKTLAEVQRQRDVAEDALAKAERQAAQDDLEMLELKRKRDELLAGAKDGPCDIDDLDLDRVRNIK